MQNNVIPIKRYSQAALAKLYLHLLNAALDEAAASMAPQTGADNYQSVMKHCLRPEGRKGIA
jgi:hypothetical protein